jgi:hypothetical protein
LPESVQRRVDAALLGTDDALERVLKAAGSSLRHYMPSSRAELQVAMADVIICALEQAFPEYFNAEFIP